MPDVTLATYALTSLDAVKEEVPSPGSASNLDNKVRRRINAASRMIMLYAGREFKPWRANPSTRSFDVLGSLVSLAPYDLQPAGAGLALSSLTGAGSSLATTVLSTDDYLFGYGDTVTSFNLTRPVSVPTRVSVTGTWGWPSVPDDVEQLCIEIVADSMRRDLFLRSNPIDDTGAPTPARMGLFMTSAQKARLDMLRTPVVA